MTGLTIVDPTLPATAAYCCMILLSNQQPQVRVRVTNTQTQILSNNQQPQVRVRVTNTQTQREPLEHTQAVALVSPVESLDTCPKNICQFKRERKGRPWVQCTECGQWCPCKCVQLSKAKASKLSTWLCPACS